jgi:hypothetical protein
MSVIVLGVLLVPSEKGVNSAGFGPSFVLGSIFGCVALPKDVVAHKAVQDPKVNRSGRACAESQHLVSVGLLGEDILAEGSHRYRVSAASSALVSLVV